MRTGSAPIRFCATVSVLLAICGTAPATRFHEYTAKHKTPPDPVKLEIATYFGTAGTEWLVGGGFLSDG